MRSSLLVLVLTALVGCSQYSTQDLLGYMALDEAMVCCKDYSTLTYQPLASSGEHWITVGKSAEAYQFTSGKSFYQAFKLDRKENVNINLTSIVGESVFIPSVVILDVNYRVIEVASNAKLNSGVVFGSGEYQLSIDNLDLDAIYLVIFTTAKDMSNLTPRKEPSSIVAETGQTMANKELLFSSAIPHSAVGNVLLDIEEASMTAKEYQDNSGDLTQLNERNLSELQKKNYAIEIIDAVDKQQYERAVSYINMAPDRKIALDIFTNAIKSIK
jgi:maltose operon protein